MNNEELPIKNCITLAELKNRRQWIVWKFEDSGRAKQTKVPYSPVTGLKTGCDESHRVEWTTYDETATASEHGDYSGIGIVLTDGVCGIDFDGKREDDTEVQEIIHDFDSYTEVSPSKEGLHVLFILDPNALPDGFRDAYNELYFENNRSAQIECYLPAIKGSRYFTFMDDPIIDTSVKDCTEIIPSFLDKYMRRTEDAAKKEQMHSASPFRSLPDLEVIKKAGAAKNGDTFRQLYAGNLGSCRSQSEADLALCSFLAFWCNGNAIQIDRLFRQSGLMQNKWDRDDYRDATIQKAISSTSEFYDPTLSICRKGSRVTIENIYNALLVPGLDGEGDFTEVAYSNLFSVRYAKSARFSSALGWLCWDGKVWQSDRLAVQELMKKLTGEVFNEASRLVKEAYKSRSKAEIDEDDNAKDRANTDIKTARNCYAFAKRMRSVRAVKGVMELAASSMAINIDECDKDPYLLNTPAGTVDLRTGEVKQNDALDYCTKITKYSPAEISENDLWDDFLNLITSGDVELITYLQTVAGAAAVGSTYIETLIIAFGSGANGKSTFFNALFEVLGSYAGTISAETLAANTTSKRFDLAVLLGKRLVIASETEEGQHLSSSVLKRVASKDPIHAERKHKNEFTFSPSHLTVLYTNHLPRVYSRDKGTWRRLTVVPFNAAIAKPQTDFLEKLLEQSGEAILKWIIDGAKMFIENGFKLPECSAVKQAVSTYAKDNDWLSQFLDECCITGEGRTVPGGELYNTYNKWAKRIFGRAESPKNFSFALEAKGFHRHRNDQVTRWFGLSLNTENEEMLCDVT